MSASLGTRNRRLDPRAIALGIAAAMVLLQAVFAFELRDVRGMYADFGDLTLPLLTRITISVAWLASATLAGVATVGAMVVFRPLRTWPYVLLAVALAVVAALTWYGPRLPIFELAEKIE
jgi:hypothetical protein